MKGDERVGEGEFCFLNEETLKGKKSWQTNISTESYKKNTNLHLHISENILMINFKSRTV